MEPLRTCLGCRSRAGTSTLVRVVARDGVVVVDESAALPGRGAWVHPTPDCVTSALARKAFGRALRVEGHWEAGEVLAHVEAAPAAREEQAD